LARRGTDTTDATHHIHHILINLLTVHLTIEGLEKNNFQRIITLSFHLSKDDSGKPNDKAYGLTNCHVLREETTVNYVPKEEAAEIAAGDLVRHEVTGNQSEKGARKMQRLQNKLQEKNEDIADLEELHTR